MAAYTAIDDPSAYFKVQLYTGNGSGSRAIAFDDTDTNMQPDFVWIKSRSLQDNHELYDSVRGVQKRIMSNDTGGEETRSQGLLAFSSDGFTVGTSDGVNKNTETYVSWNWKESAVSGMDIVSFTGNGSARTISHNLSAIPEWMIIKKRSGTDAGAVYIAANGNTNGLLLSETNANDDELYWNDTTPTSSVFTLGTLSNVNTNTQTYIAYLFAPKQGFSKFGKYTGNGADPNGPYVYLGFSPQLVIIKRTDSADDWKMHTKKVEVHNPLNQSVKANSDVTEATESDHDIDFLSNGFKLRENNSAFNADGGTYVYMAFADSSFVNSNGVPNNAQ